MFVRKGDMCMNGKIRFAKRLLFVLAFVLLLGAPFSLKEARAATKNGFVKENGKTYYYENGQLCKKGFVTMGGKTYYFSKQTGAMAVGWVQNTKGQLRYFDRETGEMLTGWAVNAQGQRRYFAKKSGIMGTGWLQNQKGQKRYFNKKTGIMATGWVKNTKGQYRYFAKKSGIMLTGWQTNAKQQKRYFAKNSGIMLTGWVTNTKNESRYFDRQSGIMVTGTQTVDGTRYRFGTSGIIEAVDTKIVGIDAGHQAQQNKGVEPIGPGSSQMKQKVSSGTEGVYTGLEEYQLNLDIALALQKELESRGYTVVMTRTTNDVDISNAQRAQLINASGADICVRLHGNGGPASVRGANTYYPSSANPYVAYLSAESQKLSEILLQEYCNATGLRNAGAQARDDLTGTNWSTVPVALLEMGYMSNVSDDYYMSTALGQQQMVQGIANGIDAYFAN